MMRDALGNLDYGKVEESTNEAFLIAFASVDILQRDLLKYSSDIGIRVDPHAVAELAMRAVQSRDVGEVPPPDPNRVKHPVKRPESVDTGAVLSTVRAMSENPESVLGNLTPQEESALRTLQNASPDLYYKFLQAKTSTTLLTGAMRVLAEENTIKRIK